MTLFSRRGTFGLALCACAGAEASARSAFAATAEPLPPNYTAPTHKPTPGQAPRMQAKVVAGGQGGAPRTPRTWAVIFREGDEIMSGLSDWMARERVEGGHLTAIGAFSSALFGWFDPKVLAYRDIPVTEQVECISLIGDIGLVEGKPVLHVHGCVGHSDGSVKGGHLLHAVAAPTLEMFVTETQVALSKSKDPATQLSLFDLG